MAKNRSFLDTFESELTRESNSDTVSGGFIGVQSRLGLDLTDNGDTLPVLILPRLLFQMEH